LGLVLDTLWWAEVHPGCPAAPRVLLPWGIEAGLLVARTD
jgi:hypothetical protein